MGKRLSDTEALVRKGVNSPGPKLAPFGGNLGYERGADDAMARGRNPGHFQRETGVGAESLAGVKGED